MAVYVDNMQAQYSRMIMCHMSADTIQELHDMADKIGINRKWYQDRHYDISKTKRSLAVKFGAKEVTMQEMVIIRKRLPLPR